MQTLHSIRYVDYVAMIRIDHNLDGKYNSTRQDITDPQFSTVALIDNSAVLFIRISYTPYGVAKHYRAADLSEDVSSGTADLIILTDSIGNFGTGDLDRSGIVATTDQTILTNNWWSALADGIISSPDSSRIENQVSYEGYLYYTYS